MLVVGSAPLTHAAQANAGDSRSVLGVKGRAKPLSFDHKPQNDGKRDVMRQAVPMRVDGRKRQKETSGATANMLLSPFVVQLRRLALRPLAALSTLGA